MWHSDGRTRAFSMFLLLTSGLVATHGYSQSAHAQTQRTQPAQMQRHRIRVPRDTKLVTVNERIAPIHTAMRFKTEPRAPLPQTPPVLLLSDTHPDFNLPAENPPTTTAETIASTTTTAPAASMPETVATTTTSSSTAPVVASAIASDAPPEDGPDAPVLLFKDEEEEDAVPLASSVASTNESRPSTTSSDADPVLILDLNHTLLSQADTDNTTANPSDTNNITIDSLFASLDNDYLWLDADNDTTTTTNTTDNNNTTTLPDNNMTDTNGTHNESIALVNADSVLFDDWEYLPEANASRSNAPTATEPDEATTIATTGAL
jgi:hypothetical protein